MGPGSKILIFSDHISQGFINLCGRKQIGKSGTWSDYLRQGMSSLFDKELTNDKQIIQEKFPL